MTATTAIRRVATYARVSSDDQAQRGTIATQRAELERYLAAHPELELVGTFEDEGVSGMVPFGERPEGKKILALAQKEAIEAVLTYHPDRMGRDLPEAASVRRTLKKLGVGLITITNGEVDLLTGDILDAIGDYGRRMLLYNSAVGIARAAREGRYCGGIVPFGFRVEGEKGKARLVTDTAPLCAGWSAADLVGQIYHWLGVDGWSCVRVARQLNEWGIPTHYVRDGRMVGPRGQRKLRTQGIWRAGRIANLVKNPVYRGELQFGRRIDQRGPKSEKRGHEIISANIEALVSEDLWQAAHEALARNRIAAKNVRHSYLLRGVMRCGTCGLAYCGSQGRPGVGWYRCNGQLVDRGPIEGRCHSPSVRTDHIEPLVWSDLEAFLRDPGDVIAELEAERAAQSESAVIEAESIVLARTLEGLDQQRRRAVNLNIRGLLPDDELDGELARIRDERAATESRLAAIVPAPERAAAPDDAASLLDDVRARLDEGLTLEQRQEVVRLLVTIVIQTEPAEGRRAGPKATITYRFPGVVEDRTGIRASRNYTLRRVIELPSRRRPKAGAA